MEMSILIPPNIDIPIGENFFAKPIFEGMLEMPNIKLIVILFENPLATFPPRMPVPLIDNFASAIISGSLSLPVPIGPLPLVDTAIGQSQNPKAMFFGLFELASVQRTVGDQLQPLSFLGEGRALGTYITHVEFA